MKYLMCVNKKTLLIVFMVMMNVNAILAENNEEKTVENQEEKNTDKEISQEDREIIKDLDILENLDMFQDVEVDFLKDYKMIDEDINNEVKTDE
ncbi:MAG: hypothetical protein ACE5KZ_03785 [Candidatus Scalinduaceae bacterium]